MTIAQRPLTPLAQGTVVNERYEIRQSLGKGGMGEVFLAYDRSTQQPVALKVVREESRMPGDDEALRQELLLARQVSHPNVCRVHDLTPSPWGPILVMEHIAGQTLHTHIRRKKAQNGYTPDEFRKIASEAAAGLAAIHAQGLVHGDLKPGNVMVTSERAIILDFGFAQERARVNARRPGAPPDGGTPNYMAPERLRSGGASMEDDIFALGLTLWEMWTCRVPEPGYKPRARPMREQIMFDVASGLTSDEVKQVFRCLNDDPALRPAARHLKFFNPAALTTNQVQIAHERLSPGPPPGRMVTESFNPHAQALLVTFASNAPSAAGRLLPLHRPQLSFGRSVQQDLTVNEATVSGHHATLRWQAGAWAIEDADSTNGTYADHSYDRKPTVTLMHGGEAQLGECRVKLVSFSEGSPQHERAQQYLARRDGLTGLLHAETLLRTLKDEWEFAQWNRVPLTIARYKLRSPKHIVSERPTIFEMLALRRAAQRAVELTELLLMSIVPATAGRVGPLKFAVAMHVSHDEGKLVVEQIVSQLKGLMPPHLDFLASLTEVKPEHSLHALLED